MSPPAGYARPEVVGGRAVVPLDAGHPGLADPAYRARRDAIASLALDWSPGSALPSVDYTAGEDATWAAVCAGLGPLWREHAATIFLDGVEALGLPRHRVPQLAEVSAALAPLSGFCYRPVAGLAPLREFYTSFGDGMFWSTQYLRHASSPLHTPEPDVCHEVLGHAHQLADPGLAGVYRAVARAAARVEAEGALRFLSRVFWRTLEFGVVREGGGGAGGAGHGAGAVKAYGAGLLSSVGELRSCGSAVLLDVDWAAMGSRGYDITRYQEDLFCAPSPAWVVEDLPAWFDAYDDDVWGRLEAA